MPSGASGKKAKTTTDIDVDWANSLAGLHLNIPNNWWKGYKKNDKTPNKGEIVKFDSGSSTTEECRFSIVVEDLTYSMRYDAIVKYVDKNHPGNTKYDLPRHPVTISPQKVSHADDILFDSCMSFFEYEIICSFLTYFFIFCKSNNVVHQRIVVMEEKSKVSDGVSFISHHVS